LGSLADRVEIVPNPAWEEGMMGSLQAGMARVTSPFFFVLPADMPFVPVRAFHILAREAEAREAEGIPDRPIFPAFKGEPGHPVLIPSSWIPEARRLPRNGRFKDFLAVRGPVYLETADPGIRTDLDTRTEYEGALSLASRSL
jgi:molybdenum cofactor cytidylyltransferase